MLPPVLSRLARDFSNIVGVKEATGDMVQGSETLEACPESFSVLSGDDLTALPLMALGGRGVISVTSNLVPGRVAAMCNAFAEGDPAGAARLHHELFPLHQGHVHGKQSHSGQDGLGPHGPDGKRNAPAALSHERIRQGQAH